MTGPDTPRIARLAAVAVAVGMLAVAYRLGAFEHLGDPQSLRASLVQLGPWGYVAFVAAFAALQPFGVPAPVFVFAAPLIWPWPVAFALSMTGALSASVVGFSFARFVARDWVATKIPERWTKYEDALARHAFATIFSIRLVFWMPQVLHAFFGVSRVRFSTHLSATAAGLALPFLVVSYFGEGALEAAARIPVSTWIAVAIAVLVVALAVTVARVVRRRRALVTR